MKNVLFSAILIIVFAWKNNFVNEIFIFQKKY